MFSLLVLTLLPGLTFAQDTTAPVAATESVVSAVAVASTSSLNSGDTAWMLIATVLVLFMTLPGLALFYGGLVRAHNVLSVFMHCFAIACLASVLWVLGLYSIAFSEGCGWGWSGSLEHFGLRGITAASLSGNIPESVFIMFQMTFAIITPALIVAAVVERMKFSAILLFFGLWLILVYAPVTHWVWGGGWLQARGTIDLAGGIMGSILVAVFGTATFGGSGVTDMLAQLQTQLIALGAVIGWSAVGTILIVLLCKWTTGLRVSEEIEMTGLDQGEHGETAYHMD